MKPPDVTRKRRKQQPKPSTSERDCTPSTAVEERLHALDGGRDGGKRLATGEEQPRQAPPRDERKEEAAPEAEQQRERRHALDAGNGEPGGSKVDVRPCLGVVVALAGHPLVRCGMATVARREGGKRRQQRRARRFSE